MTPELTQRIIETLTMFVKNAKYREDDIRQNTDPDSVGGYSDELTEAIDLLEELKGS